MQRSHLWLAGVAVALLAATGCVEKEPSKQPPKKIDREYIERNLLAETPALSNEVNADLGGKVVYLGNQVEKTVIAPGDTVLIQHYWKVVEPPGGKWRVFSHVVGANKNDWMNVDYTDMRAGHPTDKWQAGQIIRDDQKITLKKDWKSPYAQVVVGLYQKGVQQNSGRMQIVSGPHDNESRVLAFRFTVVADGATHTRPYVIRRTAGPIAIDGKADEEAWAVANRTPDFVDTEGGQSLGQKTSARLLWDDQYLYVFVEAADTDVFSEFVERDDSLWKADVIELFIDADRNRHGYVELQVNPNNAQFDAWFEKTRHSGTDKEWSAEMKSAVNVRGTTANRHDTDQGWDVEIAIPLAAVKGRDDKMRVTIPPRRGDEWKLNIVRVDKPKDAKQIRASSLSKITIQDFHGLDRLMPVYFGDAEGQTGRGMQHVRHDPPEGAPANEPAGAPATVESVGQPAPQSVPAGEGAPAGAQGAQ